MDRSDTDGTYHPLVSLVSKLIIIAGARYVKKLAPDMGQGTAASVLMSSYNIGMFVTSLFTGPLSDR